jgi:hypothetical protein
MLGFQRYLHLIDRKEILPVVEVLVPCQPKGNPSGCRGTCTSLTGRKSFRSLRYTYLAGGKETLPAGLGYPPGFWGERGIRILWRVSVGNSG